MYLLATAFLGIIFLFNESIGISVCAPGICTCKQNTVNCASKQWRNLSDYEFPSTITNLNLKQNILKFDSVDDRQKIENISSLRHLDLSDNPLGVIPPFNLPTIQTLSLDNTSLTSVEFPAHFSSALGLQKISLSHNRIGTIKQTDFTALKGEQMATFTMNDADLESIDPKAFEAFPRLQSLSLNRNRLKSCDFVSNLKVLASIKLDHNQFKSLPEQLTLPHDLKTFSFIQNLITVIDETSPLSVWQQKNFTNIKLYLANNSFDCCRSQWFIRFLKTSSFVTDASQLTCAQPTDLSGKKLISLEPDDLTNHCGTIIPKKPWLIIASSVLGGVVLLAIVISLTLFIIRQRRTRSGYVPIDGNDDPLPSGQDDPNTGPVFPPYGVDDDTLSDRQTVISTNTTFSSVAPTISAR